MMLEEISFRPYIIKAIYEWCLDNRQTPYMVAQVSECDYDCLSRFIKDEKIVLNISPEAVRNFVINQDGLAFTARFDGQTVELKFPLTSIVSFYALEYQKGIIFPFIDSELPQKTQKEIETKSVKPKLKII